MEKKNIQLKDFANKIVAENSFVKASFGGFAGAGKSRTATDFIVGVYKQMKCKKPILIIDNEKGSRFLIPLFKNAGIEAYVKETVELADVLSAFEMLNTNQIDFLFVDSLTKVWYKYVRDYKEKNRRVFMTLQDWGKILPSWQEQFADKFVALTGNCVFTGRGGYTYDMEENSETKKKEFVKSGVKMKMAGETPFEPDLNIWMEIAQEIDENGKPKIWREALVMKDRSALIDGQTFINPKYADFKPVVDYLLSTEKGDVAKSTDTTNLAPKEVWDERRARKEVVLEKIKAEFDRRQFSTGKEDKQIKVYIAEKCFGTSAWAEVELKKVEDIEAGYSKLVELFVVFDQEEFDKLDAVKNHSFNKVVL
jgi:hypothetical protein